MTKPTQVDPHAEARIVAALMGFPGECLPRIREFGLRPEEFSQKPLRAGFSTALKIAEDGLTPDVVGVSEAIARASGGRFDREGVLEELSAVTGPATVADLDHYLGIVRELYVRRHAMGLLSSAYHRLEGLNGHERVADEILDISRDLEEVRGPTRTGSRLGFMTLGEIRTHPAADTEWLVHGLLAIGSVTLLAAGWKVGKSTLVFGLLRALETGTSFAGFPTRKSAYVYLSEESMGPVAQKADAFGLSDGGIFLPRERFDPKLSFESYMAEGAAFARESGAKLLVVDTWARFGRFGPDGEKDSGVTQATIDHAISESKDLSILILTHHRKQEGAFGEQIRGSTALMGAVDIIIEVRRQSEDPHSNVRVLEFLSRNEETPTEELCVELRAGTYHRLGSQRAVNEVRARDRLLDVLRKAVGPMTKNDLFEAAGVKATRDKKLVDDLIFKGLANRSGTGKRGDPYLYSIRLTATECERIEKGGQRTFDAVRETEPPPGFRDSGGLSPCKGETPVPESRWGGVGGGDSGGDAEDDCPPFGDSKPDYRFPL